VIAGVVAIAGVALVIGAILGGGGIVISKALGLGADGPGTHPHNRATLYLPKPTDPDTSSSPVISISPNGTSTNLDVPTITPTGNGAGNDITLTAGETSVGTMQNIDLSGTYPGGEGEVLQVQRQESGKWVNFLSINAVVTNGQFSTYVQTSRTGNVKWRVIDTDTQLASNAVTVSVH
jgi:hypothetical protein